EEIRSLFERALGDHKADDPLATWPSKLHSKLATRHSKLGTHSGTRNSSLVSQHYNEMHGLIVNAGKNHCYKAHTKCEGCPLEPFLPAGGPRRIPRPPAAQASEPIAAKPLKPRTLS